MSGVQGIGGGVGWWTGAPGTFWERARDAGAVSREADASAVRSVVEESRGLIAGLVARERELEAARGRVGEISRSIERVRGAGSLEGVVALRSDGVGSPLPVRARAQEAGFLLSCAAPFYGLDLATSDSTFVIEVAGNLGSRTLSFASGTLAHHVAAAIRSFEDVTGVRAYVSGSTGSVRLQSIVAGGDQFVSVRIIDDGGIEAGDGIYGLDPNDYSRVGAFVSSYADAGEGVIDHGRDAFPEVEPVAIVTGIAGVDFRGLELEGGVRALATGIDARGALGLLG